MDNITIPKVADLEFHDIESFPEAACNWCSSKLWAKPVKYTEFKVADIELCLFFCCETCKENFRNNENADQMLGGFVRAVLQNQGLLEDWETGTI